MAPPRGYNEPYGLMLENLDHVPYRAYPDVSRFPPPTIEPEAPPRARDTRRHGRIFTAPPPTNGVSQGAGRQVHSDDNLGRLPQQSRSEGTRDGPPRRLADDTQITRSHNGTRPRQERPARLRDPNRSVRRIPVRPTPSSTLSTGPSSSTTSLPTPAPIYDPGYTLSNHTVVARRSFPYRIPISILTQMLKRQEEEQQRQVDEAGRTPRPPAPEPPATPEPYNLGRFYDSVNNSLRGSVDVERGELMIAAASAIREAQKPPSKLRIMANDAKHTIQGNINTLRSLMNAFKADFRNIRDKTTRKSFKKWTRTMAGRIIILTILTLVVASVVAIAVLVYYKVRAQRGN